MTPPAYVVTGADPVLRDVALARLVNELVGSDDRTLAVEELTVPGRATAGEADAGEASGADARETAVAALLNALQSPPFMTHRRVVVVRDAGNLSATDAKPVVAYLAEPMATSVLVLVPGSGRLPADLVKKLDAVKALEVGPTTEKTSDVLAENLRDARMKLTSDATKRVTAHLGDDAGRVPQLVEVLAAAFAAGSTLDVEDVEPYLGEAGAVPGWRLTNAIEAGDIAGALETLHRMLSATGPRQPRPMHPLQIIGMLHSQYRRLLQLSDSRVRNVRDAIDALGGRMKEYPARKALEQAHALRTDGLRQAFDHLFAADLDLKGARAIPEEAVLEVLVARLAALSRRSRRSPARNSRRR